MSQIFNGKAAAEDILDTLRARVDALATPARLGIIDCTGEHSAFIAQKKELAEKVGMAVESKTLKNADTPAVHQAILHLAANDASDAIVVQLPLPTDVDATVLNNIPPEKDPDILSDAAVGAFFNTTTALTPPTAQAVMAALEKKRHTACRCARLSFWVWSACRALSPHTAQ